MDDPRQGLDRLIDDFLALRLSFKEFRRSYSIAYIDEEADRDFAKEDLEFYGMVHERSDWTADQLSPQDRVDGWQDEREYIEWLRAYVHSRGRTS